MQQLRDSRVILALLLAILAPAASAGVEVSGLSCEYLANPVGIDVSRPRLSWKLESAERGERQTAFQILVAGDPQRLAAHEGNLWDSGKVRSAETLHVEYGGKPLVSGQRCWWKVRAWDGQDRASSWSEPALWEMGLVAASDWNAQWIGRDEPPPTAESNALATAQWIWFPEGNPAEAAPVATRYFRRTFDLPQGRAVRRATCFATADNQFVLYANGKQAATGGNFHVASAADVEGLLQPGRNVLAVAATNAGDKDNPAGLIVALRVEFDRGEPLLVVSDGSWRSAAAASAGQGWEKPAADDSSWQPARPLGPVGMAPWGKVSLSDEDRRLPARMLRKELKVTKKVRQARVYLCGLGYYELHLNGKKVGDRVLDPPLTDYDQKVFYVTYDVTGGLVPGPNAVGVVLGNGRYFAPRLQVPTPTRTYGHPKLLLQMHVEYEDGSVDRLLSDASWKLTAEGPIRSNNDYDGEEYDARREMPGWSRPGFDDSAWSAARRVAAPKGRLAAPTIPPMRVTETIAPVRITSPQPGVHLVDVGQNLVGWCRLKVRGPAGTRVELRHAETLGPDGMLYVANLRSARATDVYVLSGQGEETYEPRFTYHGFRYVEVRGYPGKLDASSIQARVVHTDLRPAGRFECSHALVNQIHKSIFWGVRGNYLSVPTDCPQRDERQGWQGDRAGEALGESFLFGIAPLYAKWLDDIRESQRPDGNLSDVCPAYWPFYSGNVTWPSAYVIIPGTLYRQYGDRRVLEEHYGSMRKWLDFMGTFVKDGITDRDTYGDWCVPPEDPKLIHSNDPARKTAGNVLATAYLCHDLKLAAEYAGILGKPGEAAEMGRRREVILAAFNKKFFNEKSATYANGSQTSSVLPLAFGMVPPEHERAVFDRLAENIVVKTKGHIGTGLVGGQWLMQTLTRRGRPDVAFRLATNDDYPSWGYMIRRGATTIWELWNGDTADPAMNSHNHVMLVGDLTAWLYEDLAGIQCDPAGPGFRRLLMRPHPVAGLDWCRATYPSACGPIESAWRIADGQFRWSIALPANTSATIFVPASDAAQVREGNGPARQAKGVEFLRVEARRAVYRIGSGRYEFSVPWVP